MGVNWEPLMSTANFLRGFCLLLTIVSQLDARGQRASVNRTNQRTIEKPKPLKGIWFVPNEGQWVDEVNAAARVHGGDLWLTNNGWKAGMLGPGYDAIGRHEAPGGPLTQFILDAQWVGSQTMEGNVNFQNPAPHHVSYYKGENPEKWASEVRPAGRLKLHEVWPGISFTMNGQLGKTNKVKYDWIVAPGADPTQILTRYDGMKTLILPDGSLRHLVGPSIGEGTEETGVWGQLVEYPPFAYQMNGSVMEEVNCVYELQWAKAGVTQVGFELGPYDTSRPLIIDPEIEFASYVGSSADSWGFTAAYDSDGRLIGGSGVRSAGYPTTAGAFDTDFNGGLTDNDFDYGISVFSSDGTTLEYSTYLGGSELEYPHSIVTNEAGDIYVMGTSGSIDFPTTEGSFQPEFNGGPAINLGFNNFYGSFNLGCDIVVSKLNGITGALDASTFVGGTDNDGLNLGTMLNYNYGDVCRGEINVDGTGDIWVASSTRSIDFPMVQAFDPALSGTSDAVVFRLDEDLSDLQLSSYFGGNSEDAAFGIQFAANTPGLAYFTGGTKSNDLPTTPGAYQPDLAGDVDGYIASLDYSGPFPALSVVTYFGTDDYDQAYFVQLDTEDRPHLCGQTTGSSMALVGDVYSANANGSTFVVRLTENLETVDWITRIGLPMSGVDISPTAFLVSDCDEMYLSGWGGDTQANSAFAFGSTTSGMPVTEDAHQMGTDGSDFWLGVLSPNAADLTYGSFFGGTFSNEHVDGGTSRFDKNGTVYQAVCAGCGGWDDFPTTAGAWENTNLSANCNLGVFKFNLGSLTADIEIDAPDIICAGEPIQFVNTSIGGTSFEWFFGDLNSTDEENPEYIYATPGEWEVMLIASDVSGSGGCLEPDTAFATLFIQETPNPLIDEVPVLCLGEEVTLQAYGSDALIWQPDPTLSDLTVSNPLASPVETTTYTVEDSNDCGTETASVTVEVEIIETDVTSNQSICIGDVIELEVTGGESATWSPIGGLGSPSDLQTTASPAETTTYTATILSEAGCISEETVTISVVSSFPGGQTYPAVSLCAGQGVFLSAADGDTYLWSPADLVSNELVQNPYVTPTENTTFTVSIANICGFGTDTVSVELVTPTATGTGGGWMCRGETMILSCSEGVNYTWSPAALVANPYAQTTEVFPLETTTFTVYVTDGFGCQGSTEMEVNVWQPPYVNAGPDREVDWLDRVRLFGSSDADSMWWSPSDWLSCIDCPTPEVDVQGPSWFTLETISPEGCTASDSVFIDVFYPVYVPNAFSPNNDGVNDAFIVEGLEPRGYRLEIFNRWGDLLFFSENPEEPWLGQNQLEASEYFVPDGVYIWRLRYEMRDGPRLLDGTVTLLR
jgi:gliding motility-associated-like protein